MKKYDYFDHTADAKFKAYGATLDEAFINAAYALTGLVVKDVKPLLEKKIQIQGKSKESLLYDYLEEFIFLIDTEGFLLSHIDSLTISTTEQGYILTATLKGDHFRNYETSGCVKSITYNDMYIKEENHAVELQVVVDI